MDKSRAKELDEIATTVLNDFILELGLTGEERSYLLAKIEAIAKEKDFLNAKSKLQECPNCGARVISPLSSRCPNCHVKIVGWMTEDGTPVENWKPS
jgi:rubrerythrin